MTITYQQHKHLSSFLSCSPHCLNTPHQVPNVLWWRCGTLTTPSFFGAPPSLIPDISRITNHHTTFTSWLGNPPDFAPFAAVQLSSCTASPLLSPSWPQPHISPSSARLHHPICQTQTVPVRSRRPCAKLSYFGVVYPYRFTQAWPSRLLMEWVCE